MITRQEMQIPFQNMASVPTHRVLACFFAIWMLLVVPQIGWSIDETNREAVAPAQISQSPTRQAVQESDLREDKKGDVTVNVQSLEDVMKVLASSVPERLDANVQPVTAAQAERYGLRPNHGVVIIWLDPKGPLGRNGLATSDIILQIDNQPVEGLTNFVSLVNSLGALQPATFSILDHRTGRIRTVRIVIRPERKAQVAKGNFVSRHVGAAVAGVERTAQSLQQQISYAAEAGKEAVLGAIRGLKRWAGITERAPVVSIKKGQEVPAKPPRSPEKEAGVPGPG